MNSYQRNIIGELSELMDSGVISDAMLEEGMPVMTRTPKGWGQVGIMEIPEKEDMEALLDSVSEGWQDVIKKKGSLSVPMSIENWRLRINAYYSDSGKKLMATVRRLPKSPPSLIEAGLPSATHLMLDCPKGMILISGPTGAGKSTSLASIIEHINNTKPFHIITIEDPIEYKFERKKSIFSQREVGIDTPSFGTGVKDAMRQRPDLIVIGEILDRDTAESAMLAAESGHLVIGTIHSNSVVGSVGKFLSFFNSNEIESKSKMLGSALVGAINQILLPSVDGVNYVLALEMLLNHKQQYSKYMSDQEKLQSAFERKDDNVSIGLGDSIVSLISKGKVSKQDAAIAVYGNASAIEMIKGT